MARFVSLRIARGLLAVLCVVALTFALGRLTGDPVALLVPQTATPAEVAAMRARMGLDQSLPAQFTRYLAGVLTGDLGTSITQNRPAFTLFVERVPATLRLGGIALLVSLLAGLGLGILASLRRDGTLDRLLRLVSLALQSVPAFVVGIVLILVFGVGLQLLPTFGSSTPRHYILPVLCLSLLPAALFFRLTRAAVLDVLNADYVRTARAKGLPGNAVVLRHALRNALLPVITVAGLEIAGLISGAVVVETVFGWPGVGQLAVAAINSRDFPLIQCVVIFSAAAFVTVNLLVDMAYGFLDPRVRLGG